MTARQPQAGNKKTLLTAGIPATLFPGSRLRKADDAIAP